MANIGFWNIAQAEPNRLALVDAEERHVSFGELLASSNRLAHGLRSIGLEAGDSVAIVLSNERAFAEMYLAIAQLGMYLTCVNYHLTADELAYIVSDSDAQALVVGARFAASGRAAANELDLSPARVFSTERVMGFQELSSLLERQPDSLPPDRRSGQVMLYTSGTTGRPKGVRRPLPDLDPDTSAAGGATFLKLLDVDPGPGAHLVAGPLYHAAPLGFAFSSLHLGQAIVLMDRWTPERTLELIERYRITTSHMVPTMFRRLLALPNDDKRRYDTSSLISVVHGAAPCPVEVKRRMIDWWGPVLYEYYAATEGGGTYVTASEWLKRPGTVGRPWPGATVKILSDDGVELPPGDRGTVYIGMSGAHFEYYKDPAKTEAGRRDGLFTVGDVGYLDGDGWLFLCDRKADVIISGGVNIYPAEIEATLLAHPAVGDVAVLGVPNEEWGEEVKAVVQCSERSEPSPALAEELVAFCRERLAGFKCPRSVDFRFELPRLPTGKLYKRLLRDEYWQGRTTQI